MFNFILTTEDSLKIIGYASLPMVVWPLLTAQTIRHPQIFLKHAPAKISPAFSWLSEMASCFMLCS